MDNAEETLTHGCLDEEQVRMMFSKNWIFWLFSRFGNPSDRNYFFGAFIIAVFCGLIGIVPIAILGGGNSLLTFSHFWILISAIYSGFTAWGWYIVRFPIIIVDAQQSFSWSRKESTILLEKWSRRVINNNILFLIASLLVIVLVKRDILSILTQDFSNFLELFQTYYLTSLVILCGFILGTGGVGFISTYLMLESLCKGKFLFVNVNKLRNLTNFGLTLAMWGFVALSLFVLITFDRLTLLAISLLIAGSALFLFGLIKSHFIFHWAIVQAKKDYFSKIEKIRHKHHSQLFDSKLSISYVVHDLDEIERFWKTIDSQHEWLYSPEAISRMIISAISAITPWVVFLWSNK